MKLAGVKFTGRMCFDCIEIFHSQAPVSPNDKIRSSLLLVRPTKFHNFSGYFPLYTLDDELF